MRDQTPRIVSPAPTVAPLLTGHYYGDAGYASWRPRGTHDWLLIYTASGRGRLGTADVSSGAERLAMPGDLALLRPGAVHDYGTARGAAAWEILWAHFLPRPHWLDWLAHWPDAAPGLVHVPLPAAERGDVAAALAAMHQHAAGGSGPRQADFAMNALETALLVADRALFPYGPAEGLDERVLRARAYLQERLAEPVSQAELASAVGLSVSRLAHLFREQIGQTPQQFVEAERMTRARQLLERTTRPVAAIAAEIGFENPFYFSLRFKRHTGMSPRDWRRQRQDVRGVPPALENGSVQ